MFSKISLEQTKFTQAQKGSLFYEFLACVLGSFLIAAVANVSLWLPFSPVPITAQVHMVLFLSVLMGRKAAYSVLFYLLQGVAGFPVFALSGFGAAVLLGPTGGYLLGYLVAAYVIGTYIEKKEKSYMNAAKALLLGNLIIYFFGSSYLSQFIGIKQAFLVGVVPFIVGDLFKIFICLKALKLLNWHQ